MKRILVAAAILCALWLGAPQTAAAQAGGFTVLPNGCGTASYSGSGARPGTQNSTGALCTSGGGGGGGAITAASGSYAAGALSAGSIVDLGTGSSPGANTTNGILKAINTTLGTPFQAGGALGAGSAIIGKVGIDQTTPGTTNAVYAAGSADPCTNSLKLTADFEATSSGGSIITAVSSKKAYICSISIIASAAANVSLIEGTGSSVCTGGTTAGLFLNSGVTAANGAAIAANGGIQAGSGNGTVAQNATANQNICVAFTTTNSPQVNVHVSYVQQ